MAITFSSDTDVVSQNSPGGFFTDNTFNITQTNTGSGGSGDGTDLYVTGLTFDNDTRFLRATRNDGVSFGVTVPASGETVVDTHVEAVSFDTNSRELTVTLNDSADTSYSVVIPEGSGGGSGGEVEQLTFNDTTNVLTLVQTSGGNVTVDLTHLANEPVDTNNYVTGGSFASDTLTFTREGLSDLTIDLSSLDQINNTTGASRVFELTANNGTTYNLSIGSDDIVSLSPMSAPTPVFNPTPPSPTPQEALNDNVLSFDAPSGLGDFVIDGSNSNAELTYDNIDGTQDTQSIASLDSDGSFNANVPAGTDNIEAVITYADTDGDMVTDTIEVNSILPYYLHCSTPDLVTPPALSAWDTKVEADLPKGSSISITQTANTNTVSKYWLSAPESGLTFMDAGFPLAHTETDGGLNGAVNYYIYDFGQVIGGPFTFTVNN